ncbi:MAG: OmpH family outer membrane protein [Salinivirgaceae bacterium]|nr:OmpH family outer membrane protein [Salinivirgaceae bacterium]
MKRILTLALIVFALVFSNSTNAQNKYKFGHIDSNQLLSIMPERVAAKKQLENLAKQLEDNLTSMQAEFEKKYTEYVAKADSLSPLIRQTKEAELGEMQQRVQAFQQNAQKELSNKESELLQPIIEKAKDAISLVADEQGFTYVFDIGTGVVLYFSDDSIDILPLVKTKLGIL